MKANLGSHCPPPVKNTASLSTALIILHFRSLRPIELLSFNARAACSSRSGLNPGGFCKLGIKERPLSSICVRQNSQHCNVNNTPSLAIKKEKNTQRPATDSKLHIQQRTFNMAIPSWITSPLLR